MTVCKRCRKYADALSDNKLCLSCGCEKVFENVKQLKEKKGKLYWKYRRNLKKGIRAYLRKL